MGGVVLLGWTFGIVSLVRLLPALTAMNPVTAALFMLMGAALWCVSMRPPGHSRSKPYTASVLGAVVAVLGILRLLDYAGGMHLHIDQLLFPNEVNALEIYPQNEMAPNTATAFVFCGLALCLADFETRRGFRPAQISVLLAGGIALFALVGYSYRVLSFYRFGSALPMALDTAVAFALFCAGFLAARPDRGLMRVVTSATTGGSVARRLLPMAICIPWLLGAVLLFGEHRGYFQQEFALAIFAALSIVIFVALIWWNAELLFLVDVERVRTERRVAVQHQTDRVLADSPGLAEGLSRILRAICETLGWEAGLCWLTCPDEHVLRCAGVWSASEAALRIFIEANRKLRFGSGEGFPGRVWQQGLPLWVPDVAQDTCFLRATQASQAGVRTAMGLPLRAGREVVGVVEFFTAQRQAPDEMLLEMLAGIGSQTGLFIERTRAEEQLRRASANLERSNADLQQFAYVASHDLVEPLRMVTSYLQLLSEHLKDKLDDQARLFIGFAIDGAQRMRTLISELLDYSRVELRGASLGPTQAEAVFRAALSNLKVAIEESDARVSHDPLPQVRGDTAQLTRLFQNLIGNALKFHGAAPPRVHVGAYPRDGHWIFFVRDNGIGINPKESERIFVIFQRLHTRKEYPGSGMGLAICKRIVERHGGKIWVESTPGKGATFFFALPANGQPEENASSKPLAST
jgi:signal transduction histidine kinase